MTQETFTAGNFRSHYHKWLNIGTNDTVLEWIRNGVTIPWKQTPLQFELNNRVFTVKETEFINSEIQNLLVSGAIAVCTSKPTCVSPIGCVPKKNKSFRLITDLREINKYKEFDDVNLGFQRFHIRNVYVLSNKLCMCCD